MLTQNRILAIALLTVPALVACDKQENHDIKGGTEADTEDATESEGASESEGATESATDTAGTTDASATEATATTGPAPVDCDEAHFGDSRPCATGTQFCTWGGDYLWGTCVTEPACEVGDGLGDGCSVCALSAEGVPYWDGSSCGDDDGGSSTPLVLSFGGAPVGYASAGHRFDLGAECAATDWPTAATPWLALDRDRSGGIEGGHELFGSATRLRGGRLADNGFTALKELDSDGDGRLTAADPGFAELVVWSDGDGDRRSTGFELQPVATLGLVAIELGYASERRCDVRGNCEVERATFTYTDGLGQMRAGEVVDVHLGCQ